MYDVCQDSCIEKGCRGTGVVVLPVMSLSPVAKPLRWNSGNRAAEVRRGAKTTSAGRDRSGQKFVLFT